MRTAAHFLRERANRVNLDLLAVLFAEECERAGAGRLIKRHDLYRDRQVVRDLRVDDLFDLLNLLRCQFVRVRKIET